MPAESRIVARSPGFWPRRPLLMGIVNVTPDSFSDGGTLNSWRKGGGSRTAPGPARGRISWTSGGRPRAPVRLRWATRRNWIACFRWSRYWPARSRFRSAWTPEKPAWPTQPCKAGAHWVNDVSALDDPEMARVVARQGAGIILMHMQGEPGSMQDDPVYEDVVDEVCEFLVERAEVAREAGLDRSRIWLDPGIGFGKTLQHNLQLFRALDRIAGLGYPVVLGASRKRFIGNLSGAPTEERLAGSLAAAGLCVQLRRSIVRVHDVAATRQYLLVRRALETGAPLPWEPSGLDKLEELPMPRYRDQH